MNSYYDIMGVSKQATADEIKKAYRKLAKKYHPDVSQEHNAEHKFKEIQEAYETLRDPAKRAVYDAGGGRGQQGSAQQGYQRYQQRSGGSASSPWEQGRYSDFFQNIFGDRAARQPTQPGADHHVKLDVSLDEMLHGGKKVVTIHVPEINHHGDQQSVARNLTVNIPQGIRSGQKIRLKHQGATRSHQGPKGDLYLEVQLQATKPYYLKDLDVYIDVPIAPWEAALGCTVQVPTLQGPVELKIAPGTQGGKKMRLKGRGLPAHGKQEATDAYAVMQIVIPMPEQKKDDIFYQKMQEQFHFNPRANWPV